MDLEYKDWCFRNAKCAEIYCQTATSFMISCTQCDLKTGEFEDFLNHFRQQHFKEFSGEISKTEEFFFADVKSEEPCNLSEINHTEEGTSDLIPEGNLLVEIKEQEIEWNYSLDESKEKVCDKLSRRCIKSYKEESSTSSGEEIEKERSKKTLTGKNKKQTSKKKVSPKLVGDEKSEDLTNLKKESEEFRCDLCGRDFKSIGAMKSHRSIMHDYVGDYSCKLCDKKFHNKLGYGKHMKTIHKSPRIKCNECNKEFRDEMSLNIHSFTHTGISCKVCSKRYTSLPNLRQHEIRHSAVRPFKCTLCPKAYLTNRELRYHISNHSSDKPYICEWCGNAYKWITLLKEHRRIHTGEKPYECKTCGEKFSLSRYLRKHMYTHTGVKPYKCHECGAGYGDSQTLKDHMHLHQEKQFKCILCGKAFAQRSGLSAHMKTHEKRQNKSKIELLTNKM